MILLDELFNYVEQVTGKKPKHLTDEPLNVPRFISMNYKWTFIRILDENCILLEMKGERLVIDNLLKQLTIINKKTEKTIVMLFDYLNSEQRARLIANRIAFIIPNMQMYLPFVFLDFRKEATKVATKNIDKFTPSNQLIFLYVFYSDERVIYAKEIEEHCKVSAMTVNRTLKLLAKLDIIQMIGSKSGAKYEIIQSRMAMFKSVEHLLINPVRFTIYADHNILLYNEPLAAGEFALDQLGMLSYKKIKQFAIDSDFYKDIKKNYLYLTDLDNSDIYPNNHELIALQVWMYNPKLVRTNLQLNSFENTNRPLVDELSLYLSLVDIDDDRLQIELEKILNKLLEESHVTRYSDI